MKLWLLLVGLAVYLSPAWGGELQDAAAEGDLNKVRRLLQATPSALNAREGGTTALHEATRAGHLEIVKFLVAQGANVNSTDFSKLTPLRLALGRQRTEIAEFLRAQGGVEKIEPAKSAPAVTPPTPSLFGTNPAIASPVVQPTPPTTRPELPEPAPKAAPAPSAERLPTEQELLAVNIPIHEAAEQGRLDQIQLLYKNSPELVDSTDEKGRTPLYVAVLHNQFPAAQTLLGLRAKPGLAADTGMTPLHLAARKGLPQMVSLLLANRAPVNAKDKLDNTALLYALQSPEAAAVEATSRQGSRKTTSFLAEAEVSNLKQRQSQVLTALLKAGAEVNVRNREGQTPLLAAVQIGHEEAVAQLLKGGANPNVVEAGTQVSPLHVAAARGNLAVLQSLLRANAPANVADRRGETPLCFALRAGHETTIQALKSAGGTIGQLPVISPGEQSLLDAYRQTESILQRGSNSEKSRALIATNPTEAECRRIFPRHGAAAWRVVEDLNRQIKAIFSRPTPDPEQGKEIWRMLPVAPDPVTRDWRAQGWIASDLPVVSLAVDKIGTSTRIVDYVQINGRWVILPPLRTVQAQFAATGTPPKR